jgi:exopolysaccharide production protein ExoY
METTTATEWREEGVTYAEMQSDAFDNGTVSIAITRESFLLYSVLKRLLDIVIATVGIVLLIPLFLAIAVWIKLEGKGSIFYFREMIGLCGRRFTILKFRTMIPNADTYFEQHPELKLNFEKNMKLQDDPRITRSGRFLRKTYLDELPQLFNVLIGQMSLVGPRAIHQRELALYGERVEKRHSVKPGMTGLWQISPDRYRCYEERISLDMGYIDTRSLFLDLAILVKTIKVLITLTGV